MTRSLKWRGQNSWKLLEKIADDGSDDVANMGVMSKNAFL